MDQRIVEIWERYRDDDEFLKELYDAVRERLPKITLTKDENGEVIMHLIDCPSARLQTKYDGELGVKVKKCSCMPVRGPHLCR